MKIMFTLFAWSAALVLPMLAQSPTASTADVLTERFLAAMGGRAAWAEVRSYVIRATHHESDLCLPYANTIWNDFAAPRVRIEARSDELNAARGIDGDKSWRVRKDGQQIELTPEQLREEQRWWEANLYRTLHRLAVRDDGLTVRSPRPQRLEVWRADGVRLNWFELNQAGEPIRFGTWADETGAVFGPLIEQGRVKCPKWGTNATGTWRYEVVELRTSPQPSTASFGQP